MKILNIKLKQGSEKYLIASKIFSEFHKNSKYFKYAIAFPEMKTGKVQDIGETMQIFFEDEKIITKKIISILKFTKDYTINDVNLESYINKTGFIYKKYNGFKRTTNSYVKNSINKAIKNQKIGGVGLKIVNLIEKKFNLKVTDEKFLELIKDKKDFNKLINEISFKLKNEYIKMRKYPYLMHYSYTSIRKGNANPTAVFEIKNEEDIFKGNLDLNNFGNFGLALNNNTIIPLVKGL